MSFLKEDLRSQKVSQLCEAASEWVEFLYADGERKGLASDGLAGLQYYLPQCQGKLKLNLKLVKAKVWQEIDPPMRVFPLSPVVVLGMAGLAAAIKLPEVAAGLLVCFDGILRSGEFYQLRVSDVTFYSERAALRLGLTRGGKRTGREEMVIINSRWAVHWLSYACAGKRGSQLVLDKGSPFFRKWFKILLSEFRLDDPHINKYLFIAQVGRHMGLLGAPVTGTHTAAGPMGVDFIGAHVPSRCRGHSGPLEVGQLADSTGQPSNGFSLCGCARTGT